VRRFLLPGTVLAVLALPLLTAAKDAPRAVAKDSPKAVAARKLLKTKVSVDYKETKLADVVDDLKDQVKGLRFRIDNKGGVSNNQTVTYKGDDVPLDEALDAMFKKNYLGYVVISNTRDAYDGTIMFKKGKERGYPAGQEPDKKEKD